MLRVKTLRAEEGVFDYAFQVIDASFASLSIDSEIPPDSVGPRSMFWHFILLSITSAITTDSPYF